MVPCEISKDLLKKRKTKIVRMKWNLEMERKRKVKKNRGRKIYFDVVFSAISGVVLVMEQFWLGQHLVRFTPLTLLY